MAGYYTYTQEPDILVLGPRAIQEVESVGIITSPTGIYITYPVDKASWLADRGDAILSAVAEAVEGIIASGLAVDASSFQRQRPSGLLVDMIEFVVEYVPPDGRRPPMQATVDVTLSSLLAETDPVFGNLAGDPRAALIAAYDALVAQANK